MKYLLLLFLLSCAGYSFKEKSNPFSQFGIKSLSIPMFYNRTNFANVSGVFTKEIFQTLSEFNKLMIYTGNKNTDAVLLGILESPQKSKESTITIGRKSVQNTFGDDIIGENRRDFPLPTTNEIQLQLRLIVIKNPTPEEIDFFQKDITANAISSKIIFNEVIALRNSFILAELDQNGTEVLGSQNRGIKKNAISQMAINAANSFKDMILYAF